MNYPCCILVFFIFSITSRLFAQPTANFSSDVNIACAPQIVKFQDLSEGGPTSWHWDFGNNNTSANQNPEVIYTSPGAYTVTLIVSNASGSDTLIRPYYIKMYAPPVSRFYADDSNVCVHAPVIFSDASLPQSSSVIEWLWDFGDGNSSTQQNPVHTYNAEGAYTVFLLVSDVNGCKSSFYINQFIKVSAPEAGFNALTSGCTLPVTVSFENTSSGTGLNYLWNFDDGSTSTAVNPVHLYNNTGIFNITLLITDETGCTDSVSKAVSITEYHAGFTYSVSCNPDSSLIEIGFSDLSVPSPDDWYWDFGDTGTDTVQNPAHIYTGYQEYAITLIATYAEGCIDTLTKAYQPVVPSFQADSFSCNSPFQVDFINQTVGTGPLSYRWDFNDGSVDSIPGPSHIYYIPNTVIFDTFFVSVAVADSFGCRDTLRDTIAYVRPYAKFKASATSGCIPLEVQFTDESISPDPIAEWHWGFGDGNTSGIQNPVNVYADTGVFSVTLKIITGTGCKDSLTLEDYIKSGIKPDYIDFIMLPNDTICHHSSIFFYDSTGFYDTSITVNNWCWNFLNNFCSDCNCECPFCHEHPYAPTSCLQNPEHNFGEYSLWFTDTVIGGDSVCISHQIPPQGMDTIRLVAGYNYCNDTIRKPVYILPVMAMPGFILPDDINCGTLAACSSPATFGFYNGSYQWDTLLYYNIVDVQTGDTVINFTNPNDTIFFTFTKAGTYDINISAMNNSLGCLDIRHRSLTIDSVHHGFFIMQDTICTEKNDLTYSFKDTSVSYYGEIKQLCWDFGDGDSLINDAVEYVVYYDTLQQWMQLTDTIFPVQIAGSDTVMYPVLNLQGNHDGRTTGTYKNPIHTYRDTGTYIVKSIVTVSVPYRLNSHICCDHSDCYYELTDTVRIDYRMYADFLSESDACPGDTVHFADMTVSTDSIVFLDWDFGDGSPHDSIQNPVHVYNNPGIYDITLVVENSRGCRDTLSGEDYLNIHSPAADFTVSSDVLCFGQTAYISNHSSGDSIRCYWDFGDAYTDTLFSPEHSYSSTGTFTVSLTVTDKYGCRDTAVSAVQVVENPVASFFADSVTGFCPPVPMIFRDSSSGADQWFWDFGDGQTSFEQNPNHMYYVSGDYDVTLIVRDTNNCTDTLRLPNYISIIGPAGTFIFYPDSGCIPHTVNFIASAGNTDYYFWDFGDGNIQYTSFVNNGDSVSHTYTSTGTYMPSLVLENANECTYIVSYAGQINIFVWPVADFSYAPVIHGKPVIFSNHSVNSYNWLWDFGNGDTSVIQNPEYTYPEYGEYTVSLIAFNPAGCPDTTAKVIYIPSEEYVKVPLAFSPNGDGTNDIIYAVYFGIIEELVFRIFNRWGEMVFETTDITSGWDGTFRGKQQEQGVYTYYIVAKVAANELKIFQKGTITLLR